MNRSSDTPQKKRPVSASGKHPTARRTVNAPARKTGARTAPDEISAPQARSSAGSRSSSPSSASSAVVRRKSAHAASARPAAAARARTAAARSAYRAEEENGRTGSTLVTSLLKAVAYIVTILVVAGTLSYFAINIGNDVFAFVKSSEEVQITIPEGADLTMIGEKLTNAGVIRYPKIFRLYLKFRHKNQAEFVSGDYTVSPSMSYDTLYYTFVRRTVTEKTTVIVSIPEGYTVEQIIDTLTVKYGLSTKEELTDVIQHYEFDYWFLEGVTLGNRKYRLEGYLYPDTYYYYSDANAETIINKMLQNFDKKMKSVFKHSVAPGNTYQDKILYLCRERGFTFDQIVTIASMIQMEAKFDSEYSLIAEVFINRLNNPSQTNGKLESDATIQYFLEERNPDLTAQQLAIQDPYNTYLYPGLPPGAISNPTYLAINYALYPANEGNYYFVATPDGTSLFAKTYKKHQENVQYVRSLH